MKVAFFVGLLASATSAAGQFTPDPTVLRSIQAEGMERSGVMEIARMLTDVYGPRLTGSPLNEAAGRYAMGLLSDWGLENVRAEPFQFDRPAWMNERYYVQVREPAPFPVLGMASPWSPGTDSLITAEAALAHGVTAADTIDLKGRLRGKAVLITAPFEGHQLHPPPSVVLTPDLLDEMKERNSNAYVLRTGLLVEPNVRRAPDPDAGRPLGSRVLADFLERERVAAVLGSYGGSGGNFSVGATVNPNLVTISVAPEHYSRIYRTVESGLRTEVEIDIRNSISAGPARPFNVLGDLPGIAAAEPLVLIGAHIDSDPAGTGATDNAAGVAVMLEAVRILAEARVPLRRPVRIGLWNGEEHGMLGSLAHAEQSAPYHAAFNLDTGGGLIRAIDTNKLHAAEPILERWIGALAHLELPLTHVLSIGSNPSDDSIFARTGPSFYFHQDPLDYYRGTHHTSQDLYDRLVPENLRTNAIIVAALVYLAANDPVAFTPAR